MATLSFHAGKQGKMTKQNIRKLVAHTFRKMEHRGKDVKPVHGNEQIDVTKTHLNYDARMGEASVADAVEDTIAKRIKRTVRKDAALAREIIVQASPDVYEGLSEDEKVKKSIAFTKDAYDWFADEFGAPNVVGYSAHHDETNPHTHFVVVPITIAEEGARKGTEILSQAKMFKGPNDLKRQHREFRNFMNARGWDFDTENKYENVDGIDLYQYKKTAEIVEAKRAEQKKMQEDLRKDPDLRAKVEKEVSDELILSPDFRKKAIEEAAKSPDVLQEASKWLKDDLFDSVLLPERRASERATKALEDEREALKAEREQLRRDEERITTLQAENNTLRKELGETKKALAQSEDKTVRQTLYVVKNMVRATKAKPIGGYQSVLGYTPELVSAYMEHNKAGIREGKKDVKPAVYMDLAVKDAGEAPTPPKPAPKPPRPEYKQRGRDDGFSR